MRVDTLAHRKRQAATTRKLASETGFCLYDDNAEGITHRILSDIGRHLSEAESELKRLYRGRAAVIVNAGVVNDHLSRLEFMAQTYREILAAQEPAQPTLQAAE